ncbi:MAG: hypothetical protein PHF38_07595 [Bacteroidales bacterium]|nr:hypothetical protein [Bacteroidales bacterium]
MIPQFNDLDKILTFSNKKAFREWLGKNGTKSDGVWLLFSKKGKVKTLTAAEALEEALCHGWIDGQIKSLDQDTYKKYFARRLPKSNWSDKNKKTAQALIEKGFMTPQGFEAIERARKDGSWDNAKRILVDEEQIQKFMEMIQSFEPAYTNLLAMPQSVKRSYTAFYFDAKSENTRKARLEKSINRLNSNLKPM